jgi:hypothetical protein
MCQSDKTGCDVFSRWIEKRGSFSMSQIGLEPGLHKFFHSKLAHVLLNTKHA